MQYIGEQVKKLADLLTVEMTVDEIICRLHDILKLVATGVDDSYTVLYEIESPPPLSLYWSEPYDVDRDEIMDGGMD
jgi:hypothetical protein